MSAEHLIAALNERIWRGIDALTCRDRFGGPLAGAA